MWVVVVVGVVALVVGLGIGGAVGFFTGVGSQLTGQFDSPSVGADAISSTVPLSAPEHRVGDFTLRDVRVEPDFADDFYVVANIAYGGAGQYPGGAIEIDVLAGDQRLGGVSASLPPMSSGETIAVELWGFDEYVSGADTLEIRID